ncbi:glycosyltransferase, partial [Pacificibacter marinus]|uniref:glycosyltransferase n=1 Tax=Pacificibacter marinus TaxID=658057 RepID=UPI001C094174
LYDDGHELHDGVPAYPLQKVYLRNLFPAPRTPATGPSKSRGGLENLVKKVPNIWPLPQLKWAATYAPFIKRLHKALNDLKPDVVIGFMPTGIMAAVEAAKPLGIPVIASTHNVPEQDFGLSSPRWDANPKYRKRRLQALHKADHILVLQDDFKQWFDSALQNKISVMPNPIAAATMSLTGPREACVIGVGRLTAIKRYDILIAAFAKISAKHPDWRLEIYGDGPEKNALQHQIDRLNMSEQIKLAGICHDIMPVYAKAGIMCHPSSFEGFGLSVAEALAHGLPVAADAACSGVTALIQDGENGILVETGAAPDEAFANTLDHLMSDPMMRTKLGLAAPSSVLSYAPDVILDRWQQVLSACQADHDLV